MDINTVGKSQHFTINGVLTNAPSTIHTGCHHFLKYIQPEVWDRKAEGMELARVKEDSLTLNPERRIVPLHCIAQASAMPRRFVSCHQGRRAWKYTG